MVWSQSHRCIWLHQFASNHSIIHLLGKNDDGRNPSTSRHMEGLEDYLVFAMASCLRNHQQPHYLSSKIVGNCCIPDICVGCSSITFTILTVAAVLEEFIHPRNFRSNECMVHLKAICFRNTPLLVSQTSSWLQNPQRIKRDFPPMSMQCNLKCYDLAMSHPNPRSFKLILSN